MRLGAFAIVAEERGFLKLLPCTQAHITQRRFFCGGSLLLSGRVIHLDGDSLILEPHSSGHHVPLSYCAYGSDQPPSAIEPLGAATCTRMAGEPRAIDCFSQRHIPAPWCSMPVAQ
jgi:hypothetical protein